MDKVVVTWSHSDPPPTEGGFREVTPEWGVTPSARILTLRREGKVVGLYRFLLEASGLPLNRQPECYGFVEGERLMYRAHGKNTETIELFAPGLVEDELHVVSRMFYRSPGYVDFRPVEDKFPPGAYWTNRQQGLPPVALCYHGDNFAVLRFLEMGGTARNLSLGYRDGAYVVSGVGANYPACCGSVTGRGSLFQTMRRG